jgi:signal transduction histidine kinase
VSPRKPDDQPPEPAAIPGMLPTRFAPAERAPREVVLRQATLFEEYQCLEVMDSLPTMILILNEQRQMVFANRTFRETFGAEGRPLALGQRPGELMHCLHADTTEGGCGTTEFCRECGAVNAILSSLCGRREVRECQMLRRLNGGIEALDLLVSAVPLEFGSTRFTLFSILDISHEKRRRALERIFFHDIINTVGGIKGLLDLLAREVPSPLKDDASSLTLSFSRLVDEIVCQKQLLAAESKELQPHFGQLLSRDVVDSVARLYQHHDLSRDRLVVVDPGTRNVEFISDYTLLGRVLGNMLKNALEAAGPGETVTIGCDAAEGGPEGDGLATFWVHNAGCIPRPVQLKMFSRSFSTKGPGRGLGTYSIKLLTERYLRGKATFRSTETDGTTFFVTLPLRVA